MNIQRLRALFNPEIFQGWGKEKSYFEGWYYKILNKNTTRALAIIPGLAYDETGKGHAFIKHTAKYHRFDINQFDAASDKLSVRIGDNLFTESGIDLHLPDLTGKLSFVNTVPWPKPFYAPGIMGPYTFTPFMECYHGIVSMDHTIHGRLVLGEEEIDFSEGRGYTEKDWGSSFPSAYLWVQTNHFSESGISLKLSIAKIPWRGSSFTGFIAGVWLRDRLYRFTTYNRSRLLKLEISTGRVELNMENSRFGLEIDAIPERAVSLASPIRGAMEGRIEESMSSQLELRLYAKREKKLLYKGKTRHAGLEIAGETSEIVS
jgi:hypothetical protein